MFILFLLLSSIKERPLDASDLIRFPDHEIATKCCSQLTELQQLFSQRYELAIPGMMDRVWWGAARCEADEATLAWQALCRAQRHQNDNDGCLPLYIFWLQTHLTPYQWRTGQMPELPWWRIID